MDTGTARTETDRAETAGTPRDEGFVAQALEERSSLQWDCMGNALRVWELMALAEGRKDIIARHTQREHPPTERWSLTEVPSTVERHPGLGSV
jgi:hypothetical protein